MWADIQHEYDARWCLCRPLFFVFLIFSFLCTFATFSDFYLILWLYETLMLSWYAWWMNLSICNKMNLLSDQNTWMMIFSSHLEYNNDHYMSLKVITMNSLNSSQSCDREAFISIMSIQSIEAFDKKPLPTHALQSPSSIPLLSMTSRHTYKEILNNGF